MKISVEILIGVILFILILAAFLIWMQARLQIITPEEAFAAGDYQTAATLLRGRSDLNPEEQKLLHLARARIASQHGRLWNSIGQIHELDLKQDPKLQAEFDAYAKEFLEISLADGDAAALQNLADRYPETLEMISASVREKCEAYDFAAIAAARSITDLNPGSPLSAAVTGILKEIVYQFPASSDGALFYTDEVEPNVQGLCTDRENYVFIACREGGNTAEHDAMPTTLRKIDRNGVLIASNGDACYCHANGMTYCSADGKLYIATLGRDVNVADPENLTDPQNENVIAVVNGETLALERYITLHDQICTLGEVYRNRKLQNMRISAVHYDSFADQFICLIGPHYLEPEQKQVCRGFAFFDREWKLQKFVRFFDVQAPIHAGSITTDAQKIYLSINVSGMQKQVFVFDRLCNYLGTWKLNALVKREFECLDFIGTTLYVSVNTRPVSIETFEIGEMQTVSLWDAFENGQRIGTSNP